MNINNAFPSKYLKSGDVPEGESMHLTITGTKMESIGQGEEAEEKVILYFKETPKGMVLNKTNAKTLSKLYGPETKGWTGKRVSLFATEVQFKDEMVLSLRIKQIAPKAGLQGAKPPAGDDAADATPEDD